MHAEGDTPDVPSLEAGEDPNGHTAGQPRGALPPEFEHLAKVATATVLAPLEDLGRRAMHKPVPLPRRVDGSKVGRNDPSPCGSGKKYKRCCEGKA